MLSYCSKTALKNLLSSLEHQDSFRLLYKLSLAGHKDYALVGESFPDCVLKYFSCHKRFNACKRIVEQVDVRILVEGARKANADSLAGCDSLSIFTNKSLPITVEFISELCSIYCLSESTLSVVKSKANVLLHTPREQERILFYESDPASDAVRTCSPDCFAHY